MSVMATPTVYHSLESVLQILADEQFKNDDNVKRLLTIYNNVHQREKNRYGTEVQEKHPFIVIEGLDASGKTTVTHELAAKIGADTCNELRQHVYKLRETFMNNNQLSTAFDALLNYILASQIANTLKDRPVVLDRYWHSTTAYSIARAVHSNPNEYTIPPYGDEIYNWPSDLLKPDTIIFVSIRESVRMRRHSLREAEDDDEILLKQDKTFRRNVLAVYGNINNPPMIPIEGNLPRSYVLAEAFDNIKHLLHVSNHIVL